MSHPDDHNDDEMPILPHLGSEFLLWLWHTSDTNNNVINFTQPPEGEEVDLDALAYVDLWVDERIAMRSPNEMKVTAVLTGDNPAATLESRAALLGGKVLQELRIGIRVDDRDYLATLKAPDLLLHGVRLPSHTTDTAFEDNAVERLLLLEELDRLIGMLFCEFGRVRVSDDWRSTVETISQWTRL